MARQNLTGLQTPNFHLIACLLLLFSLFFFVVDYGIFIQDKEFMYFFEGFSEWFRNPSVLSDIGTGIICAIILTYSVEFVLSVYAERTLHNALFHPDVIKTHIHFTKAPEILEAAISLWRSSHYRNDATCFASAFRSVVGFHAQQKTDIVVRNWDVEYIGSEPVNHPEEIQRNYIEIQGALRYRRRTLPEKISIMATIPDPRYERNVLQDPNHEFVWEILSGIYSREQFDSKKLKDFFEVSEVRINSEQLEILKIDIHENEKQIAFVFAVPEQLRANPHNHNTFPFQIAIKFRALQVRSYGFIAANVKYITHGFTARFDYAGIDRVEDVFKMNHIVGSRVAQADQRSQPNETFVRVDYDEWVLPESGVTFTWTEQSEETFGEITRGY